LYWKNFMQRKPGIETSLDAARMSVALPSDWAKLEMKTSRVAGPTRPAVFSRVRTPHDWQDLRRTTLAGTLVGTLFQNGAQGLPFVHHPRGDLAGVVPDLESVLISLKHRRRRFLLQMNVAAQQRSLGSRLA
jgi:hypothetical protein